MIKALKKFLNNLANPIYTMGLVIFCLPIIIIVFIALLTSIRSCYIYDRCLDVCSSSNGNMIMECIDNCRKK